MKETGIYVYCLLRSPKRPSLAKLPAGLPETGRPRLIAVANGVDDDLWLVVADAPLARYGEKPIAQGLKDLDWVSRCAVAHEAVVARFLRAPALMPMRLLTLFTSDERAVAHVTTRRRAIDRALDRVAGCVEWGVRVSLDEHAALASAEASARRHTTSAAPGTGFLLRKSAVRDAVRDLAAGGRAAVDQIAADLEAHARDAVRQPLPAASGKNRLLLDAAFLAPGGARGEAAFRRAVAKVAKSISGAGYEVELTGPWPAYNFARDAA